MRLMQLIPVMAMLFSVFASAQTIPDAGALMRQTEQNIRFTEAQRSARIRDVLPPQAELTPQTLVEVKRFKFNGNARLTDERLQNALNSFTNRPLNQHDLQHVTEAVTEAYRQSGWLVEAYVPRQDLSARELTIQVIESIPPHKPNR